MTRLALIFLIFVSLAPVANAAAPATTNAPPGQSAIDQYLETVPDGGGNRAPGGRPDLDQPAVSSKATAALPPKTLRALKQDGADGRAAAALAAAFAPSGSGSTSGGLPSTTGSNGLLGTVADAVTGTDGGGFGALYPALLIAILIGVVAVAVVRRRGGSAPA